LVLKFYNDPTVNESEIVVFLRQVWWAAGKRNDFERKREKMKMRERRGTMSVKTDLTLFIVRFNLFIYYFIKTNFILFSIKQINKIPFLFFLKSLF